MADDTPAPIYSEAKVAEMSEHWRSSFPAIADLHKIPPEARPAAELAHMEKFKQAMADQGVTIPPPVDTVALRLAEEHMVAPVDIKPDAYDIQWPREALPYLTAEGTQQVRVCSGAGDRPRYTARSTITPEPLAKFQRA